MTKTVKIQGMMCEHCEATVKKALESLENVTEAKVSHEAGTAVLTLSGDVSDDVIRKAVEEKAPVIKAFKVDTEAKTLVPFELELGDMTDEERQIILKGCLINYNRV